VFRFALRAITVALFVMIIAAGLFGNQNPALNIAPILTWTVWWGMLIVLILFAGKAWCYVCPWDDGRVAENGLGAKRAMACVGLKFTASFGTFSFDHTVCGPDLGGARVRRHHETRVTAYLRSPCSSRPWSPLLFDRKSSVATAASLVG
jgi:hypothetical protein